MNFDRKTPGFYGRNKRIQFTRVFMTYFYFVKKQFYQWLVFLGSIGITHYLLAICGYESEITKITYDYDFLITFISASISCIFIVSFIKFIIQNKNLNLL